MMGICADRGMKAGTNEGGGGGGVLLLLLLLDCTQIKGVLLALGECDWKCIWACGANASKQRIWWPSLGKSRRG